MSISLDTGQSAALHWQCWQPEYQGDTPAVLAQFTSARRRSVLGYCFVISAASAMLAHFTSPRVDPRLLTVVAAASAVRYQFTNPRVHQSKMSISANVGPSSAFHW
jgi:hypothetical protein